MMRCSSASGFCVGCVLRPPSSLQPLGARADREQPVRAHLQIFVQRLHRLVIEGVARLGSHRRPDQRLMRVGEAAPAEIRHLTRVTLHALRTLRAGPTGITLRAGVTRSPFGPCGPIAPIALSAGSTCVALGAGGAGTALGAGPPCRPSGPADPADHRTLYALGAGAPVSPLAPAAPAAPVSPLALAPAAPVSPLAPRRLYRPWRPLAPASPLAPVVDPRHRCRPRPWRR